MSCFINPRYKYTVTVPDNKDDFSKNKNDYEFDFMMDEKEKPVIILFGWAGSTDKHLSVYSKIYEAKGLTTVRLTVGMKSMFAWKHHIYPISKRIVNVMEELNLNERPIIAHCFSNGGSYLYHFYMEAVKSSKNTIKIKGVIFDSTPTGRTIQNSFRAIRYTVPRNPIINIPISLLTLLVFMFIWMIEMIKGVIFRRRVIQFKPMSYLLAEENRCPQHFIYSYSDKVMHYKDIECFINKRKAIGVDVSSITYNDTEHVKHYPSKKYTYTQSIFNFISKCLDIESSRL